MAAKWRSLTCGTSAACKCVGAAGGAATSGRSPSFQRALERLRRPQAPQLLTPWRDDTAGAPRAAEARLEAGVPLKARRSPIVRRASRVRAWGKLSLTRVNPFFSYETKGRRTSCDSADVRQKPLPAEASERQAGERHLASGLAPRLYWRLTSPARAHGAQEPC